VGKKSEGPGEWRVAGVAALITAFFFAFITLSTASAHEDETCLTDAAALPMSSVRPSVRASGAQLLSSSKLKVLRLVVVASGDFTAGRSDAEVFEQIDNALTLANEYLRPLRVTLQLAGVQSFQPALGDPYAAAAAKHDASQMLKLVKSEWTGRNFPAHDLVAVFGRSAFGATYGLAYPDTVCLQPNFAFLFASQGGAGQAAELSFGATLAHEVGHTLGLSHDSKFYPEGPSLMWPSFTPNVGGFSSFSLSEFDAYKMAGGTSCLPEAEDTSFDSFASSPLVFSKAPSQTFQLREGERLRTQFTVTGFHPGVTYSAENLPAGAQFDGLTGLLDFTPDFALLAGKTKSRTFDSTIVARTFNDETRLAVRFNIARTNRAPFFGPSEFNAVEGEAFHGTVNALDADGGDKVSLKVENSKAAKAFPGKPKMKTGGATFDLNWLPPVGSAGDYVFALRAKDKFGGEARTNVFVHVRPIAVPPTIDAPLQIAAEDGNTIRFEVRSSGAPDGTRLIGLEPGMLIRRSKESIEVQYAPAAANGDVVGLTVQALSGRSVVEKVVPIVLPKGGEIGAVSWPGAASQAKPFSDVSGDGDDDISFYSALTGDWRHVSCSGTEQTAAFGGRTGDLPIVVRRAGKALRAIFRIVDGQGWWMIDDGASTSVAYGLSGDVPLTADLNGDGDDELIVYRPRSGEFFVSGFGSSVPFAFEASDRVIPFAGDVDGDGRAELARFRRLATGEVVFEASLSDGSLLSAVVSKAQLTQSVLPLFGDIDGDGRVDFGAQVSSTGTNWFLSGLGKIVTQTASAVPSQSLFAFRRCFTAGAGVAVFDPLLGVASEMKWDGTAFGAALGSLPTAQANEVTVESGSLRASMSRSVSAFGDSSGSGVSELSVWRENRQTGTGQWIRRASTGQAAFYSELPAMFSYRTFARLNKVLAGGLTSFADGLWTTQEADGKVSLERWGAFGDVPVPGDYNGDGRTDLAIFRANDGSWWILFAESGTGVKGASVVNWGIKGDIPVPSDYDGDGTTDVAIWRPSTGGWYIRYADGRTEVKTLGAAADLPAPGDYLGLGRSQLALFRPSTGEWIIQGGDSKSSIVTEQWGLGSDTPVVGDFDGDGRQDLAVFRESEGNWYLRNSGDSNGRVNQFGLPGDEALGTLKTIRIF